MAAETQKRDVENTVAMPPPHALDGEGGVERVDEGEGEGPIPESIQEAKEGTQLSSDQELDAMEWLLGDESDEVADTRTLRINVGTDEQPRRVTWVIQALDGDSMIAIRRRAAGQSRAMRRQAAGAGETNEYRASLGMVAAATVEPDLAEVARAKKVASPEDVIRWRFRQRQGLVMQISSEIMDLSGWDEEDVQRAVKN